MMKTIKDLKTALRVYEEMAVKQGEAMKIDDYVTENKCYDIHADAVKFIKEANALGRLKPFLSHASTYLRMCAAWDLLPVDEKEALQVLEEVAKTPGVFCAEAQSMIWLENMRKIKDLDTALKVYEATIVKQGETLEIGDYKTCNKCYDIHVGALAFIKEAKALHKLKPFLYHASRYLRICAAWDLLPVDEKEALQVLEQVAKTPGIFSIDAKHMIGDWKWMDNQAWLNLYEK